jgi:hypothetical protein
VLTLLYSDADHLHSSGLVKPRKLALTSDGINTSSPAGHDSLRKVGGMNSSPAVRSSARKFIALHSESATLQSSPICQSAMRDSLQLNVDERFLTNLPMPSSPVRGVSDIMDDVLMQPVKLCTVEASLLVKRVYVATAVEGALLDQPQAGDVATINVTDQQTSSNQFIVEPQDVDMVVTEVEEETSIAKCQTADYDHFDNFVPNNNGAPLRRRIKLSLYVNDCETPVIEARMNIESWSRLADAREKASKLCKALVPSFKCDALYYLQDGKRIEMRLGDDELCETDQIHVVNWQ